MFSEEVTCAEDVGGWKKLCKEDYLDLARRVADSVEEIKNENEELDPDELVPVSFQGEMREAPDGLEAMLLPFQIEGVSWMYYQETSGESGVRGGMLCDEVSDRGKDKNRRRSTSRRSGHFRWEWGRQFNQLPRFLIIAP